MRLARQLKITFFFTLCLNNPNIAHEDGGPEIEQTLTHPSGILAPLVAKADAEKSRPMDALEKNYWEVSPQQKQAGEQLSVRSGRGRCESESTQDVLLLNWWIPCLRQIF